MMMIMCNKKHLSKEFQIMEKLSNTDAELKYGLLVKKACNCEQLLMNIICSYDSTLFPVISLKSPIYNSNKTL